MEFRKEGGKRVLTLWLPYAERLPRIMDPGIKPIENIYENIFDISI